MAVERLDHQTHILAYNPWIEGASPKEKKKKGAGEKGMFPPP